MRTPKSADGVTRIIAAVTSGLFVAYLGWRVTTTDWSSPLGILFLALELFGGLSFGLFVFSAWDIAYSEVPEARYSSQLKLAIFITTFNEDEHVLLPVVAAAVALQPFHETWILDDGDRPWVREMAEELGATYLAREQHDHAKAGNINHALARCDADMIGFLDADHIPAEGFLAHTIAYFDDPTVAVVQTPQDFYNTESFEHIGDYCEEELFYRVIQPGKNRWNGSFWCGTSAVLRRSALESVGGVATDSVTEDFLTTIRLQSTGWRTVFHNEVLARGLAPTTYNEYLVQRKRWAAGGMQIIRSAANPLWVRGLSLGQRLAHVSSLMGWFEGVRTLGYLVLAVGVVLTNSSPVSVDLRTFLVLHLTVQVASQLSIHRLGRGRYHLWPTALFDYLRIPITLAAIIQLVSGDRLAFQVTAKGRAGGIEDRANPAPPLSLLVILVAAQMAWLVFILRGFHLIPGEAGPQAIISALVLVANSMIIGYSIRRIRMGDFGNERRRARRFTRSIPVAVDGERFELARPSTSGGFIEGNPRLGKQTIHVATREGAIAVVCWVARHDDTGATVEFVPGQWAARSHLARTMYSEALAVAHHPVRLTPAPPPVRRSTDQPRLAGPPPPGALSDQSKRGPA